MTRFQMPCGVACASQCLDLQQHACASLLSRPATQTWSVPNPPRCLVPEELNTLIAGQHDLDPQDWQAHAAYTNCCAATPLIAWFWELTNELSQPQLASLLGFVTGSTTLPAGTATSSSLHWFVQHDASCFLAVKLR